MRYSTRVSSTPAGPTMERPGSTMTVNPSLPDAVAQRCDEIADRRRAVGRLIGDAQAAAQIDVVDRVPVRLQTFDQRKHLARGFENRRIIENLRADVATHARGPQMFGTLRARW